MELVLVCITLVSIQIHLLEAKLADKKILFDDASWFRNWGLDSVRTIDTILASNPVQNTSSTENRNKFDYKLPENGYTGYDDDPESLNATPKSRCNFEGKHLRVAVSPQPPLVSCFQDFYGDWSCNGSNIEVINVLEKRLNFHAEWVVLANGRQDSDIVGHHSSKTKLKDDSRHQLGATTMFENADEHTKYLSGVFRLVGAGRSLLSANGIMHTLDRSNRDNLIISEPFDMFRMHFLLSKFVRDHDHIFVKPFEKNAWLAILISAALIVPIFYIINTTSAYYLMINDKELRNMSFKDCIRHWLIKINWSNRSKSRWQQRRISEQSTDSSLDEKVNQMIESGGMFDFKSSLYLKYFKGEGQRRRQILKRKWVLERKKAMRTKRLRYKSGFFNLAYIVWYVVASLANQGGETEDLPQASSTRILVAFWWLYLIVVFAIHSGILTAILTFPKQLDFIKTLEDYLSLSLSERNEIKLVVNKHSEIGHLLENVDNLHKSPLQMLVEKSSPVKFVDFRRHRERVLDEVQQGKSALIEDKSTIDQLISQEYFDSDQSRCWLKSSRYPIDVIPMSFMLSKYLPEHCVNDINIILRQIRRTGLAQKWRRKYEPLGNDCLESVIINAGDVKKIELKNVILAFWLLFFGITIGLVFLIGEICWLFLIELEEEENDSKSSVSSSLISSDSSLDSSSSDEWIPVRLGNRQALQPSDARVLRTRRSVNQRSLVRHLKSQKKIKQERKFKDLPNIIVSSGLEDEVATEHDSHNLNNMFELKQSRTEFRRRKRIERVGARGQKRLQRTIGFIKRVHDRKIYSDNIKKRVRRASHAFKEKVTGARNPIMPNTSLEPLRRRTSNRVAPMADI